MRVEDDGFREKAAKAVKNADAEHLHVLSWQRGYGNVMVGRKGGKKRQVSRGPRTRRRVAE